MTDVDLRKYARGIPYFRNVYMRDALPDKVRDTECGIVNLDDSSGPGTHWVAYVKRGKDVLYFDSFGNLRPPAELVTYFSGNVYYNHARNQKFHSYNCGHLCLQFLINNAI